MSKIPNISDLSSQAQALITKWHSTGKHVNVARPSWDQYYLDLAFQVRSKSIDSQTQCGAVITTGDHVPLGLGYNSFVKEIDDSVLPNVRPDKYPFMVHAEINAVLNCSLRPVGGILYVTGPPCDQCLQLVWQSGIREIVYANSEIHMCKEGSDVAIRTEILLWLLQQKGLVYRQVEH